ncbi:MAG TPA: hypothetical protein VJP86_12090, partial [Vicinamibacterales bacterium]|nr:hypothetical protein [Vicinamibacterales bacterium]
MDGPAADQNPPARPPDDRLDSWKEIAGYLKRDVSTVQRWERREGMPVHRHLHDKIGSVYAIRGELDAWSQSRKRQLALDSDPQPAAPTAAIAARPFWLRPGFFLSAAVAAIAVTVGVFVFILTQADYLWQDPIANARFVQLTDFEGAEHSAAISRDGKFVAFLSDRDGRMDAWVTQVGTGQFYNLTHGSLPELVN